MHTHFSAVSALSVFMAVLLVGTVWRLGSLHLTASKTTALSHLGQAMAFQY